MQEGQLYTKFRSGSSVRDLPSLLIAIFIVCANEIGSMKLEKKNLHVQERCICNQSPTQICLNSCFV